MPVSFAPRILMPFAMAIGLSAIAHAQGRTDIVTLPNGDRVTGEVVRLERGRLQFKTDDARTLSPEWDKIASVVAERLVEVLTSDGRRFLGTLGPAPPRDIAVVTAADGTIVLKMTMSL